MSTISSVSSNPLSYLSSASGIESLISEYMTLERESVTRLETQIDELEVRRAVYEDINTKLEALRTAAQALYSDGDDSTGTVFDQLSATSSAENVLSVTNTSDAAVSQYDVSVNWLAQSHLLSSARQAHSDQALGLSGTFIIGGASTRAVSGTSLVTHTVDGFSTGSNIQDGQSELGSGRYYVEVRHQGSWQFRLVDENGDAVRIADTGGDGRMTGSWQDIDDVAGQTYDTGRGLTIDFGDGNYTSGLAGSGAASLNYTAQGASVTVNTADSLNDIRDAINEATFADGNQVTATVVNQTLVLTSTRTGDGGHIDLSDVQGSVLSGLGLLSRTTVDDAELASDEGVTAFGTADLANFSGGGLSGVSELSAGRYYVEIGSGSNADKFRLVDAEGNAVAIADTSGGTNATTDWISITDGTYDTGRGLTITFQGDGNYAPGVVDDGAASTYYDTTNAIRSPRNASLTVNGLDISRNSNSGLDDIVDGLTFNLTGTGESRVNVDYDYENVVSKTRTMVKALNDVLAYIQAKAEPQVDQTATDSEQTIYTRGLLGNDWSIRSLRQNLVSALLSEYTGATLGNPNRLLDVGITLDTDSSQLAFEISDVDALESALEENYQAVQDLFGHVLGTIEDHISPFLDGTSALIVTTQSSIDDEIESIEGRIESAEARLLIREETLRQQFQAYQTQLYNLQNQYQFLQAFSQSSLYNYNQEV